VLCGLGASGSTALPVAELLARGLAVLGFAVGGKPAPPEPAGLFDPELLVPCGFAGGTTPALFLPTSVEFSPPGDHESARARGKLTVNVMDRTANTAIGLRKRI
jgi:hypothetical protein